MDKFTSHGHEFSKSDDKFGFLRESNDIFDSGEKLQARMKEDGYLFLRGVLDRSVVNDARRALLDKLASVDEVSKDHPLMDAIFSGTSTRGSIDTRQFGVEMRTLPAVKRLVHDGDIIRFFEKFLGGEVRSFDYIWLRTVRVGGATGCHYDKVYMGRGTERLYTAWTPIGDVPYEDGALMVLENSHKMRELIESYGRIDVDSDDPNPYGGGWFSSNPVQVQAEHGGRWLTAGDGGFRTGDLLVFTMYTMHCSLDNKSPVNRIRLTSDTRYQLASEPIDERWVGDDPMAHGPRAKRKSS
ncbi:MAG: phytanoyl-CoA dioxygenase family protein [Candidatus Poribacteria bacterium]|nr:phytanoyl-CoA dioxygenase family protein [Candidatus Poribacteria bacterium]